MTAILVGTVLLISLVPGLLMVKSAREGHFVMPQRQTTADLSVAVAKENVMTWAMAEEFAYAYAYKNLRQFKFAVMYVPVFAFCLLAVGMLLSMNKRLLLYFIWAFLILLAHLPEAPIYHILHKHVFYYTYFRNLHFFLWLSLIPIFILFVSEALTFLLDRSCRSMLSNRMVVVYLTVVHLGLAVLLAWMGPVLWTTYGSMGASWFLCIGLTSGLGRKYPVWIWGFLMAVIVVQPLEVYTYLNRNESVRPLPVQYTSDAVRSEYMRHKEVTDEERAAALVKGQRFVNGVLHYATPAFNELSTQVDARVVTDYTRHKFKLYTQTLAVGDGVVDYGFVEDAMRQRSGVALIHVPLGDTAERGMAGPVKEIRGVEQDFVVGGYSNNRIQLDTDFSHPTFVVMTDSYHPHWRATIDGRAVRIVRTNIAFKGFWVPAGAQRVVLRFGLPWLYALNYFLLMAFYGMFVWLALTWIRASDWAPQEDVRRRLPAIICPLVLVVAGVMILSSMISWNDTIRLSRLKTLNRLMPPLDKLMNLSGETPLLPEDLEKYIFYYNEVNAVVPGLSGTSALIGVCRYYLDDLDGAIVETRQAAAINPEFFWHYYNLGVLYVQKEAYVEASSMFQQALAVSPEATIKSLLTSKVYTQIMASRRDGSGMDGARLKQGYVDAQKLLMFCRYMQSPKGSGRPLPDELRLMLNPVIF